MIESINEEKCKGCGLCIELCVMDVFSWQFKVKEDRNNNRLKYERKASIAYPEDCMTCYMCEMYCPNGAISVNYGSKTIPSIIEPKQASK